jgi:sugar lactone lactonase YvrE
LPAGLFIDRDDRVYVVDSYNRRIQVFHYHGLAKPADRERR